MKRFSLQIGFLTLFLTGLFFFAHAQETITLTTYYPAPYGVYLELRAKKMALGPTYFNPSTVIPAGTDLIVEEKVGVGMAAPLATLQIGGLATDPVLIGGNGATAVAGSSPGSIVLGTNAQVSGPGSIAMGNTAKALSTDANVGQVAIGHQAQSTTSGMGAAGGVALGAWSNVTDDGSAIGRVAVASAAHSVAIGPSATSTNVGSITIGDTSKSTGLDGIALGAYATAGADDSVAVGHYASTSNQFSIALGEHASTAGQSSTALGGYATTNAGATGSCHINLSGAAGNSVTQANTLAITGGPVGIGTVAPACRLDVFDAGNNAINAVSTTGFGVIGQGSTEGVDGVALGNGARGVNGSCNTTWGIGVSGWANLGYGVQGAGGDTGVLGYICGMTYAPTLPGSGVIGGGTACGVYGNSGMVDPVGLKGVGVVGEGTTYGMYSNGNTIGVWGTSGVVAGPNRDGTGVQGTGTNFGGVFTGNYGVWATGIGGAPGGIGVQADGSRYAFYADSWTIPAVGNALAGGKYGPFTGAHDCLLPKDYSAFKPGMIVCSTGKAHMRKDVKGNIGLSTTLPLVKFANQPNDKTVFGVFLSGCDFDKANTWYEGKEPRGIANALGEGRVWVSDINGPIAVGDFITTSYVVGYGQKQDDDLLHSYTLGKATEQVDWDKVKDTVEYKGKKYKAYLIAVTYTSG